MTIPPPSQPQDAPATPAAPSLTARTASGVFWSSGATVIGKATALVGQIVLAWLLMPEDFGLIALTYTVLMFTNLIREAGIRQILIQRQAEYETLAGPAFWLSATLGLVAGLTVAAIASPVAVLLDAPGLKGLLLVCALAAPLDALGTLPSARLQIDLRFRFFAVMGLTLSLWQMGVTVALAWWGAGAYSFVIAMVSTAALRTAWLWAASGMERPARPRVALWLSLTRAGGIVAVAHLLYLLASQADRIILQLFRSEAVVGIYYLAYSLSLQTTILISYHLAAVLMPALSRIQDDPPRQRAAFVRAVGLMMLVGVPVCAAQAALAEPVIRLLFAEKFYPAVVPLQLLSLSMAFRLAGMCAVSLLQAQGRFATHAWLMGLQAALVVPASAVGAHFGGAPGVALAVLIISASIEFLLVAVALTGHAHRWRASGALFLRPMILAVPAFVPVYLAIDRYRIMSDAPLLQLIAGGGFAAVGYVALVRLAAPAQWSAMRALLASLLTRGPSALQTIPQQDVAPTGPAEP